MAAVVNRQDTAESRLLRGTVGAREHDDRLTVRDSESALPRRLGDSARVVASHGLEIDLDAAVARRSPALAPRRIFTV